jgi:hypothetical protein
MTSKIEFYPHQRKAVTELKTGSILCGGVGSGKSLTALLYYYTKECKGKFGSEMKDPKDLYIITTAKKRDKLDWNREAVIFLISTDRESSINGVKLTVDSWNNIKKYADITDSFFIFDEQRVIGSGAWVRSFLKITKQNNWILLSATPGDTWMDYIPVFVANGFYKNRTQFIRRHVVYNPFTKFPKIQQYLEVGRLERLKRDTLVLMDYERKTVIHRKTINAEFDKKGFDDVCRNRWNIHEDRPIRNYSEFSHLVRRIINSDPSRIEIVNKTLQKHQRLVVFYNFNYELDILKKFKERSDLVVAEYNGHKHEEIPEGPKWLYLVQYLAGSEGWDCLETNVIVFYSLNWSYRIMKQAAGRIDRLNTPFRNLFYYYISSLSPVDKGISKALKDKKDFNLRKFRLAIKTYPIVEEE